MGGTAEGIGFGGIGAGAGNRIVDLGTVGLKETGGSPNGLGTDGTEGAEGKTGKAGVGCTALLGEVGCADGGIG